MTSTSTVVWEYRGLLVVACLLGLFVPEALPAQEPPSSTPEISLTVVVPLLREEAAPFSGLLVPEGRFRELMIKESMTDAFQEKLEVERKAYDDLERVYFQFLSEANKPRPWYQSPEINRWLGFGAGVMVAALVTLGVVEVYKVSR
jgi:hypothetical protein